MKTIFVRTHAILATFISLAVLVQMLLAGLWHAAVFSTPAAHVILGFSILLASLLVLVAAIAGKMGSEVVKVSAALFVLVLLQPILIETRRMGLPAISALHTVNAAFIGMTGGKVLMAGRVAAGKQGTEASLSAVAAD